MVGHDQHLYGHGNGDYLGFWLSWISMICAHFPISTNGDDIGIHVFGDEGLAVAVLLWQCQQSG